MAPDDVLSDEQPTVRRVETSHRTAGGPSLFRRSWRPDAPQRVVMVVHGFAEHSGRYENLGAWLARRHCAVEAFDQRGHGRTPGARGHVASFEHLLDDVEAMVERLEQEHAGLPIHLVGHSMGGLVVAATLRERHPPVASAVLSGAALAISEALSGPRLTALRVLRRIAPRVGLPVGLDVEGLSRDPEVVRRYQEDPLVFDRASAAFASGMLELIARTDADGSPVRCPVLVLHGEDDPLCPAEGSVRFHDSLDTEGSDLRLYPGLRHEIFNEPEGESIFAELLHWIRDPEAAGEDPDSTGADEARKA